MAQFELCRFPDRPQGVRGGAGARREARPRALPPGAHPGARGPGGRGRQAVRPGLPARSPVVPAQPTGERRGLRPCGCARPWTGCPPTCARTWRRIPIETAELPAPEDLTAERPPLSPDHPGSVPRPAARPRGRQRGGRPRARRAQHPRPPGPPGQRLGPARGARLRRRRARAGHRALPAQHPAQRARRPTIWIGPSSGRCCTRSATCAARTTARCATEDSSDSHPAHPLPRPRRLRGALAALPCCWGCWRPCSWPPAPGAAEDESAGRKHWDRGQELYKQGRFLEAAREFEAGYAGGPAVALPAQHRPQLPPGPGAAPGEDGLRDPPEDCSPTSAHRPMVEDLISTIDDALQRPGRRSGQSGHPRRHQRPPRRHWPTGAPPPPPAAPPPAVDLTPVPNLTQTDFGPGARRRRAHRLDLPQPLVLGRGAARWWWPASPARSTGSAAARPARPTAASTKA